jgi:ribosomal protein S18 acetylase RimI-like enzyme
VRSLIRQQGTAALVVDDLRQDDLALLEWSGSPLHIQSVAAALARVPSGEVEYLVVRAPGGTPIAKGGIEYADPHGPGKLYQLATHPGIQSLGIGSHLIAALEDRIRTRGFDQAWLGVELDNLRARALYERLSYQAFAEETDGWETEDTTGRRFWKETRIVVMRHTL